MADILKILKDIDMTCKALIEIICVLLFVLLLFILYNILYPKKKKRSSSLQSSPSDDTRYGRYEYEDHDVNRDLARLTQQLKKNSRDDERQVDIHPAPPGYNNRDNKSSLDVQQRSKFNSKSPPPINREQKPASPAELLVQRYNNAVISQDHSTFKQKYLNRVRIGVVNTEKRLLNQNETPEFAQLDSGNFWGIEVDNQLLAVPKLAITLLESHHGPGAMSYVFDYDGFDSGKKYSSITISRPAVFVANGSSFTLKTRGTLQIGTGIDR